MFKSFIAGFCKKKIDDIYLDDEVKDILLGYSWPGNVRELRNVAEALSFYGSDIKKQNVEKILYRKTASVSTSHHSADSIFRDDLTLKELERYYYKYMIARHSNSEVAKLAGIARSTLWRKIKELEIED